MARKADAEDCFFCQCMACKAQGPQRNTALQAVEAARLAGWHVSAEMVFCWPCDRHIQKLEACWAQPAAIRWGG